MQLDEYSKMTILSPDNDVHGNLGLTTRENILIQKESYFTPSSYP